MYMYNSSSSVCDESKRFVQKEVNADSPGSYLVKSNYLAVLWLRCRSCSGSCWFQTWCIVTACCAVKERTVYDLGG